MNIADKMTKKVNEINKKVDGLNKKISPVAIPDLPQIKGPSRRSQKLGALTTVGISVGVMALGMGSKLSLVVGLVGIAGAGFSFWDATKK